MKKTAPSKTGAPKLRVGPEFVAAIVNDMFSLAVKAAVWAMIIHFIVKYW